MSAPTAAEKELIQKFREELKGILDETKLSQDHYLIRWIRARESDLSKAKEMIINSLKWRKEHNIDNILTNSTKNVYFEYHYKYWLHGHDKNGQPLLVVPSGRWDIKGVINDGKTEGLMLEFARMMEDTMKSIEASGKLKSEDDYPVTQFVCIADCSDFAYSQVSSMQAVNRLLDMASTFEGHYPETVSAAFAINCPRIFMWILPLIKALMSGVTVSKLRVFGANKDEWLPELLKVIDASQLFPEYGGTSTFEHPLRTDEEKAALQNGIH